MAAYLFVWNPKNWSWTWLDQAVDQLSATGRYSEKWSCASHKSIRVGDRAFLLRLGSEPKGIMGSGLIATRPFLSPHWDGSGRRVERVVIDFDALLHPDKGPLLDIKVLNQGSLAVQTWTPQSSGISIRQSILPELEAKWFEFLASNGEGQNYFEGIGESGNGFFEGAQTRAESSRYERNPHARRACLEHYGLSCVICGFNFERHYGELGSGYIHVHHLRPVSVAGGRVSVDPIKDLRPVCPNCHAMLHRSAPPLGLDDLESRIQSR